MCGSQTATCTLSVCTHRITGNGVGRGVRDDKFQGLTFPGIMNRPRKEYLSSGCCCDTARTQKPTPAVFPHRACILFGRGIKTEEDISRGNWLRQYCGACPLSDDTTSALPLFWAGFATTLPYCHPHVRAESVVPTIVSPWVKNFISNPSWKYPAPYCHFQHLPQHVWVKHIRITTTDPEVIGFFVPTGKTQQGIHDRL